MAADAVECLPGDSVSKEDIGLKYTLESFVEDEEVKTLIDNIKSHYDDKIYIERCFERFTSIFDRYQEQPHLLDPKLDEYLTLLLNLAMDSQSDIKLTHYCFKLLYIITKVRGYKVVLRHLPHETSDLEPVLHLLNSQISSDTLTWETRYMLLLWLSIIVMIPFQLTRLDGNIASELVVKKSVIDRVLDVGKQYLLANDKPQDAAAYLTSKFVTRPDIKTLHLKSFIDWALNGFSIGQLSSLARLFKHGTRDDLIVYAPRVLDALLKNDIKSFNNTIMRKLAMKLIQRLGMTFLKPRVASWRYRRGNRSLEMNLLSQDETNKVPALKQNEEEEEDFDVPEEIELILQTLLSGLNDKDTVIRWSAAKGIGRVGSRLPKELADEVVGSVLELFENPDRDAIWHGGCLALAELGRRGLLLPERLTDVVPVVVKALVYDEQKGSFSVGDHVRDAACYVCWAFARAYDSQEMKPFVNEIASALLTVTVFDREIHCRRAASAAFQENVGRQGTFPNGIDIVTTADYFSVGNRNNAFLNISVFIAQFPAYRKALVDHLVEYKINHWDVSIRELAASALHNLTPFYVSYVETTVLPKLVQLSTGSDMNTRHGAILAVGEIIYGLYLKYNGDTGGSVNFLNEDLLKNVRDIIPILKEKKLFRGFGGELMRMASCKLVEKISFSKLPFHCDSIIEVFQSMIDDCLRTVDYPVLKTASETINAFCKEYYRGTGDKPILQKQEWLINNYLHELDASVETSRMGFIMAIGALPAFMLIRKIELIIPAIVNCTKITEKTKGWVKARKEALATLVSICNAISSDLGISELKAETAHSVLTCHLEGLSDYTIDSCGDVGSHVRNAALLGIKSMVELMVKKEENLIPSDLSRKILEGVLQQCVEKIENIRKTAGFTFYALLYGVFPLNNFPHRNEILKLFPKEKCESINWSRPAETFESFASIMSYPTYQYSLLLGFTATLGSLSEHLVRVSIPAICSYLKTVSEETIQSIGDTILQIFRDNVGNSRVTLPLLKAIDQLISTGHLDCLIYHPDANFNLQLMDLIKTEVSKCKDPLKIMSGTSVLCDLLPTEANCRNKIFFQLCLLLCHPWPLVRKDTATKMYTAFATYDGIVEDDDVMSDIMNLLSETNWVEAKETIRPIRNNLCDLLNIQKPVFINKT